MPHGWEPEAPYAANHDVVARRRNVRRVQPGPDTPVLHERTPSSFCRNAPATQSPVLRTKDAPRLHAGTRLPRGPNTVSRSLEMSAVLGFWKGCRSTPIMSPVWQAAVRRTVCTAVRHGGAGITESRWTRRRTRAQRGRERRGPGGTNRSGSVQRLVPAGPRRPRLADLRSAVRRPPLFALVAPFLCDLAAPAHSGGAA